ncbi:MAG: calcium-translocating P-type ATPase, PMCA-type [Bacteroides sp.]|nr:calcium-translocating P-type ATPase, PMCA-type [Bacteroides sp.]
MKEEKYRGLTAAEVEESRRLHGTNLLTPPERESLLKLFLEKFRDPLIIILLIAGVLSIVISFYEYYGLGESKQVFIEPVGIFMAIILATGLGFYFEYKAEQEFAVLNRMSDDEPVMVVRDGNTTTVARREVVVGDIVILQTGEEIPADCQLLEAMRLSVDESTLTGEPMARKTTDAEHFDPEATFPSDMVLRGTKVIEGHGVARVTAVGDATEAGKVFEASRIDNSVRTPLNEQLDRLGSFISVTSYVIGALVIVGRIVMYLTENGMISDWMRFTTYLLQSLMLAVTLVVVSVPEGLPMAVTLSLAYSMRRMLRTDNLVRRMHACETMGAVTTICTDKTGTLTANRMEVAATEFLSGDDAAVDAMTAMALNSTADLDFSDPDHLKAIGNPTEGALLLWINSRGADYRELRSQWKREAELPFTTEQKYMASVISNGSERYLIIKGAPEIVYGMCDHSADTFSEADIKKLLSGYQQQAMRTLGFASVGLKADDSPILDNGVECQGLRFDMVTAISDPVREDVPPAIEECLHAGIRIKIVTGDTPATATEIGRQIGLWTEADGEKNITTGADIAAMTDEELTERVEDWKIIARARPMDKKRLVEALQRRGEVVAVTGDGTNDAPALKAAHVGLSMGDGTAVAKEASDITILNNSFSGITNAVMWGRSLYRNIQRFILFQLTVNLAACLTVLIGSFMGTQAPLTVTQMLWVNLIMDTFAAMALASLPPSRSVLKEKPRDRRKFIINGAMSRAVIATGMIFGVVMIGLLYLLEHASISSTSDLLHPILQAYKYLTPYELALFFTFFVMLQVWNLFNARAFATGRSALHLAHCGEFVMILLVIFFGQIAIVSVGGEFFNVVPITVKDWIVIILVTMPVLIIGEAIRAFGKRGAKEY